MLARKSNPMNNFENLIIDSKDRINAAHIFGSAPTVTNSRLVKETCLKIAVGDMPWRAMEFGTYDFWMTANSYYPLPWRKKDLRTIIKNNGVTFINSSCVNNIKNREQLFEILEELKEIQKSFNKIIFYDQTHFKNKLCEPNNPLPCCIFFKYFNLNTTIQESFAGKFNVEIPFTLGHQTLSAVALALMLNFKSIYISGVELPSTYREYRWHKNWKFPMDDVKLRLIILAQQYLPIYNKKATDFSGIARNEILNGFLNLGEVAQKSDVKIYTTSISSPLNNLPGYFYINSK
jgi:hypothetical protein